MRTISARPHHPTKMARRRQTGNAAHAVAIASLVVLS